VIAIDGPAGAGKSTVARRLADRLGFLLVDTGALYRAVAFASERQGVAWQDAPNVEQVAEQIAPTLVLTRAADGSVRVALDGDDISEAIRTPRMATGASMVSAYVGVRLALLGIQRQAALQGGVVLEGRDIGTSVFPDAEVKFFLTAQDEVRARRRHEELLAKGTRVTLEETLADVRARDQRDRDRPVAPLRQASDAVLVDSSNRSIDAVVEEMAALVANVTR
jgi:cytidylate kinase